MITRRPVLRALLLLQRYQAAAHVGVVQDDLFHRHTLLDRRLRLEGAARERVGQTLGERAGALRWMRLEGLELAVCHGRDEPL